ncbi:hypothetical protein JDV02_006598 [Purpureocillium takamizusanense]|uniref:Uncharacterized protein n=1 Tax=Purpureocillium takamizusanense TaxID=2060973 RepID=A0A9Q8QKL4_9HYPO|nr:uncharacterized protein JDV02_006598 [Purpureocillium takamizusanense]UNI20519.1 hypothetical protein JDV02_006598 [Purpureocillium takamizusanense]
MPHYGTTGTYRIVRAAPVENALGLENPASAPPPTPITAATSPAIPSSPAVWMNIVSRFYSGPANVCVHEGASRPGTANMSPASAYSGYDASVSDMTEDANDDDDEERTLCGDVQKSGGDSPDAGCLPWFTSGGDRYQLTSATTAGRPKRSCVYCALVFATTALRFPVDIIRRIVLENGNGNETDATPPPRRDNPKLRTRRNRSHSHLRRDRFPPGPSPLSFPPLLARSQTST